MIKKRVLIHVDLKRRDMAPIVFLKYELEELGMEVALCSRVTARWLFLAFRPHIFVNSHCYMHGLKQLNFWRKYCELVVVPTEGAIDFKSLFLADVQGNRRLIDGREDKTFTDLVKRYYSWGDLQKSWLIESGIMNESQVLTTGSTRYDTNSSNQEDTKNEKKIGFLANYSRINLFDRRSILKMIDAERKVNGGIYHEGKELEGGFWCIFATARLMFEIFDNMKDQGNSILLRPHPNEWMGAYDPILEKYSPKIELSQHIDMGEYLKNINVMIVMMSTSVIDAIYCKVPVICLEDMLGGEYLKHVDHPVRRKDYLDWLWRPKNHDELNELIERAKKGELPVCPQIEKFSPYLSSVYNLPCDQTASKQIALDLKKIADQTDKSSISVLGFGWFLYYAAITFRFMKYIVKPSLRKEDQNYHLLLYQPKEEGEILKRYKGLH